MAKTVLLHQSYFYLVFNPWLSLTFKQTTYLRCQIVGLAAHIFLGDTFHVPQLKEGTVAPRLWWKGCGELLFTMA